MKSLYFKLACSGIAKNKKLYIPYILTCVGMVTMYYIIYSLSKCPLLDNIKGGGNAKAVLLLGTFVIVIFSAIFLFYTNSFLVRRRNKEFGLYNILGMNKRNISKIIGCESLIVSAGSILIGTGIGILLSKLAELGLLNVIRSDLNYSYDIPFEAVITTFAYFGAVFLLLFLNSLRIVGTSNPLALLGSESLGEKPPKGNFIIAVIGLILLASAYFVAVSITRPLDALSWFFLAVIMVITATYMLFISGSVVLCKILKKNKKYYYKKSHFVSVSSMLFRMKRNGAGLASICILCTMVLVMLSSTICLYIGAEDSINARYPRDIVNEVTLSNEGQNNNMIVSRLHKGIDNIPIVKDTKIKDSVIDYCYSDTYGLLKDNRLITDVRDLDSSAISYSDVCYVMLFSLEDYNKETHSNEKLGKNEAIISLGRMDFSFDTLSIDGAETLKIKKEVPLFVENGNAVSLINPTMYVVVDDYENFISPLKGKIGVTKEPLLSERWYYGFNVDADEQDCVSITNEILKVIKDISLKNNFGNSSFSYSCNSKALERGDFYTTFGGLFFIGIMLSIMFVFAAVLIIYYKQISEGYEDRNRFDIMQKIGMTKKDIRKSINSQVLTVFFLPLVFAGLHLAFAFPLIWKMLQLFNMYNLPLLIVVTICAFIVFGILYGIIYHITSNVYYSIVSNKA